MRIIVPVAAGGPTDIVARTLADKLSAMWKQQVFVENKPGAGNNLGCEYVARSDPDGYTVLFDPGAMASNTSLYGKLTYDAVRDFAPVSMVALVDYFMFVPNSSPAHTLKEFVEYVKARPGKLTMASPGTGSAPYLAEMSFLQMAGLKMTHVPYRGAAPAFTDLIPGPRRLLFRQRHLAVVFALRPGAGDGGDRRETQSGGAGRADNRRDRSRVRGDRLAGAVRSGKDPPEIVRKMSADTNTALADPAIQKKLVDAGYVAGGSTPEELGSASRPTSLAGAC